jgi:antitoxin YqcF
VPRPFEVSQRAWVRSNGRESGLFGGRYRPDMPAVTEANRTIARATAAAFGGVARVVRHADAHNTASIDILSSVDRPWDGVTSYATIGLSDWPMPGSVSPPLGVEIVGAVDSRIEVFGNVLATAAFCVINSGWRCEPGAVFSGVVQAHLPNVTLPHMMFVPPFLWEDDLRSRRVGNKTVAWLLGVPISDSERDLVRQNGAEALEDRLERAQIDVFDLERTPVV